MMTKDERRERRAVRKAERERRAAFLATATRDGVWSGRGDECAIRCRECDTPMLILAKRDAPPEEGGIRDGVWCIPCGFRRFTKPTEEKS